MDDRDPVPGHSIRSLVPEPDSAQLWNPPYCGEIDIRIARDGQWYHEGRPIRRLELVQLFSSVLRLEEDGRYCLVTPVERVGIQVEDCPFVARLLDVEGEGRQQSLHFQLNTGERVTAGAEHRIFLESHSGSDEPHPVLDVRQGLRALISRNVFYQLVTLAMEQREKEEGDVLKVWSQGLEFVLGGAALSSQD